MGSFAAPFIHVFRLADGEVLRCSPREARRTVAKREERMPDAMAEVVWEVTLESGLVRRLWPEDVVEWTQEET